MLPSQISFGVIHQLKTPLYAIQPCLHTCNEIPLCINVQFVSPNMMTCGLHLDSNRTHGFENAVILCTQLPKLLQNEIFDLLIHLSPLSFRHFHAPAVLARARTMKPVVTKVIAAAHITHCATFGIADFIGRSISDAASVSSTNTNVATQPFHLAGAAP